LERRKEDHVRIALESGPDLESPAGNFNQVHLIHEPLSDLNLEDLDLRAKFLGREISLPLIISCMTGGFGAALDMNRELALAAQSERIPIGVGSVRAGLADPSLARTFYVVRELAPSVPVISNLGAQQLAQGGVEIARKAVELVGADALAIHFNKLQEAIMPEGETRMRGVGSAVRRVVRDLGVPCVAKETGAGISKEAARLFRDMGFEFIDVAGYGGTSFAAIETRRAMEAKDKEKESIGRLFLDWGIPTAASLIEVASVRGVKVIASGGIRSGLDAAKAIALGADHVAVARPILERVARGGSQSAVEWIRGFARELRVAMFLAGAHDLAALRRKPVVVTGWLRSWAESRGLNVKRYSMR